MTEGQRHSLGKRYASRVAASTVIHAFSHLTRHSGVQRDGNERKSESRKKVTPSCRGATHGGAGTISVRFLCIQRAQILCIIWLVEDGNRRGCDRSEPNNRQQIMRPALPRWKRGKPKTIRQTSFARPGAPPCDFSHPRRGIGRTDGTAVPNASIECVTLA